MARYVVGEPGAELPLAGVLEHGLIGLASERVSGAVDPQLLAARALAKRGHERNRELVSGLLAAWAEEGIETLLFKGFALAEFVYPDPSWRPYSDVDAAIDERHVAAAAGVAQDLGWQIVWRAGQDVDVWSHHGSDYFGHELLLLEHPSGLSIDVHRRLLHNNDNRVPRFAHQERISRAVWAAARRASLEGVTVMLPRDDDAALVGLVLNRYWSGDRYELRATDYLDLARLAADGGLDGLMRRAAELGCTRTLKAFLGRCDPFRQRLDLTPLGRAAMAALDLELAWEHGHRPLARLPRDLSDLAALLLGIARELPAAYRLTREAGEAPGVPRTRQGAAAPAPDFPERAPAAGRTLTRELWHSRQAAVRNALKLAAGGRPVERRLLARAVAESLQRSGIEVDVSYQGQGPGGAEVPGGVTLHYRGRRLSLAR